MARRAQIAVEHVDAEEVSTEEDDGEEEDDQEDEEEAEEEEQEEQQPQKFKPIPLGSKSLTCHVCGQKGHKVCQRRGGLTMSKLCAVQCTRCTLFRLNQPQMRGYVHMST